MYLLNHLWENSAYISKVGVVFTVHVGYSYLRDEVPVVPLCVFVCIFCI